MKLIIALCVTITSLWCMSGAHAQTTLGITEIMYDCDGSDTKCEWIEIYNYGDTDVSVLTGSSNDALRFFDGSFHVLNVLQGTSNIPIGGYAIFASDAETWMTNYPEYSGIVFDTVMSLKNSSSTLGLSYDREVFIENINYDSINGGNGNGFTLERGNEFNLTSTPEFVESLEIGGTPGEWSIRIPEEPDIPEEEEVPDETEEEEPEEDSTEEEIEDEPIEEATSQNGSSGSGVSHGDIRVNEILPNPEGSDANEWIELYNPTGSIVDINGWKLQDNSSRMYTIGNEIGNTEVRPFDYIVIDRLYSGIALNNSGGDKVILYKPDEIIRETISYEVSAKENFSYARFNDEWKWTKEITPGSENKISVNESPVAAISISEQEMYYVNDVIEFDASGSYDNDGDELSYVWKFGDDSSDDERVTTHVFDAAGVYEIELEVSDSNGLSASDFLSLEITDRFVPGELDVSYILDAILITELLPNPDGKDTNEWIELYNTASTTFSLTGWKLDDAEGGSKPFVFEDVMLKPLEYRVFEKSITKISLTNSSDSVRLITPDGTAVQEVSYESAPSGQSYTYDQDNVEWLWITNMTPGKASILAENQPDVLGAYVDIITDYEDLDSIDSGSMQVEGIVLVSPHTLYKQKMFIAEFNDGVYESDQLLEVYQYRGNFPELIIGDVVSIFGELTETKSGKRLKISGTDDVTKLDHYDVKMPELTEISLLDEFNVNSFVSLEGIVTRINKKSFSISDGELSITIYIQEGFDMQLLEKDMNVRVAGFLKSKSNKLILYVMRSDDMQITENQNEVLLGEPEDNDQKIINPEQQHESPLQQMYYLSTVPIIATVGWFLKKYFLVKL